MGLMDKFLNVMHLNDEDDDDYDFANDEYFDEEEDEKPVAKATAKPVKKVEPKPEKVKEPRESKITPISKPQKKGATNVSMEVCVIKPTTIEEEYEITDTLLNGRTVIINMEGLNIEIAQRIIDFISGSVYAMNGNLQKISNYIFLATPNGVDISGDIQNLVDTYGNNDSTFTF